MYAGLPLATDRLIIRELVAGDLDPFCAMHGDLEVMRYCGGSVWPREHCEMMLTNIIGNTRNHPMDWVAVCQRDNGAFLGMVCLLNMPLKHREAIGGGPYVEIGWRFAQSSWGHGYATEAARALLEHAFGRLKFPRIVSIVDVRNARSLRVCEKLGLERVKTYSVEGLEIWFHSLQRQP